MQLDASFFAQGYSQFVPSVVSKMATAAELRAAPTTPITLLPAVPGLIYWPGVARFAWDLRTFGNVDPTLSLIVAWGDPGAPLTWAETNQVTWWDGTIPQGAGLLTPATTQFSKALADIAGRSLVLRVFNGALGDLTGGDGSKLLAHISYSTIRIPQLTIT